VSGLQVRFLSGVLVGPFQLHTTNEGDAMSKYKYKVPQVYIVVGDSGSHEDHETWNVAAFASREQATQYAIDAQKAVFATVARHDKRQSREEDWFPQSPFKTPYDREAQRDVVYHVKACPFFPAPGP
jgi:hypothetical protein